MAFAVKTDRRNKQKSEWAFDSIEDVLEAVRRGRLVVVVDDEGRENEGD
ncbi:MAG: 3,4-dihydroxy-2-butanone-4-phosphate synthase, partial [Lentisphaerae bacterium]|nr:3,4-dihydroxy-2-butanone-4-phosphate synthase [Lentisphaerota bacterium]